MEYVQRCWTLCVIVISDHIKNTLASKYFPFCHSIQKFKWTQIVKTIPHFLLFIAM